MAKVPYNPVPDITPITGGEQISVNTPGAAFGENIGAALQHLGTTVEQSGQELFARAQGLQELRNQADARNAQSDLIEQTGPIQTKFDALEGKASADQLQQHLADLRQVRENIRKTLQTPDAQQHFDSDSMPFIQRLAFSSMQKAGDQFKQYTIGAATASLDLNRRSFVNPNDPDEFNSKLARVHSDIATLAHAGGPDSWSPEKIADETFKQTSMLWANRVGQIADTNAIGALKMAEEHQRDISPDQYKPLLEHIYSQLNMVASKAVGEKIYSADKPLQQMYKEASNPDNVPAELQGDRQAQFIHSVQEYIRTKNYIDNGAVRQQQDGAKTDINQAITQYQPKSLQELKAIPGMNSTISLLKPSDQLQVEKWIGGYWASRARLATELGAENFNNLKSQAITDPRGFLDSDPSEWKVSPTQRNTLLELRGRVSKGEEIDPQVHRAIGFMQRNFGEQLHALNVYSQQEDQSENKTEYNRYITALSQGINAWMETHNGKPPTDQELLTIGGDVIKTHPQEGWFTKKAIFGADKAYYDVPDDILKEVTADVRRDVPDATDKEIYREALRKMFKDLYSGGSKPATGSAGGPAPVD